MTIEQKLSGIVINAIQSLYNTEVAAEQVQFQTTKKEFEGDITLVVFPFVKAARKSPEQAGQEIGEYLQQHEPIISGFNVIKGFLNLSIASSYWLELLSGIAAEKNFGTQTATDASPTVMIEYSSPNTNKPLHLGHVRNNLLGFSLGEILKANGNKVVKTNIVNDRGIHICKSMLAWQKFGNGETPESTGMKGDHLVGKYYVVFDQKYKAEISYILENINNQEYLKQILPTSTFNDIQSILNKIQFIDRQIESYKADFNIAELIDSGLFEENILKEIQDTLISNGEIYPLFRRINPSLSGDANELFVDCFNNILAAEKLKRECHDEIKECVGKICPLMLEAQEMLRKWEANDPEVYNLWQTMNTWVYAGFDVTYKKLGVDFDCIYYESETYLLGKEKVEEGLANGVLYQREDGSVWIDLTAEGLDEKLLLRSDGTSVYMTQDIGTAKLRYDNYPIDKMVYVVGNEQNYHFQVLSIVLDKLGFSWGKDLVHFSYGMVELPEGKMKSREGTVVDADDLVDDMVDTARETSQELGKLDGCTAEEAEAIARMVGLGALKYFILKVDPRKNMTFNPKESIDFNGNTGPFIQYTHARIKSVLRKAADQNIAIPSSLDSSIALSEKETSLIQLIAEFPNVVKQAGTEYSPSVVANYTYELVKEYNQFYHDFSILKEENEAVKGMRLMLSQTVAGIIKTGMSLLGIEVPERM